MRKKAISPAVRFGGRCQVHGDPGRIRAPEIHAMWQTDRGAGANRRWRSCPKPHPQKLRETCIRAPVDILGLRFSCLHAERRLDVPRRACA